MRPGPLAAASLRIGPAGLALSEQLILAGLRTWARARMEGEEPRALIRPSLTHVASRPVASVFVAMMETIEREAARAMQVHCVACGGFPTTNSGLSWPADWRGLRRTSRCNCWGRW